MDGFNRTKLATGWKDDPTQQHVPEQVPGRKLEKASQSVTMEI